MYTTTTTTTTHHLAPGSPPSQSRRALFPLSAPVRAAPGNGGALLRRVPPRETQHRTGRRDDSQPATGARHSFQHSDRSVRQSQK